MTKKEYVYIVLDNVQGIDTRVFKTCHDAKKWVWEQFCLASEQKKIEEISCEPYDSPAEMLEEEWLISDFMTIWEAPVEDFSNTDYLD